MLQNNDLYMTQKLWGSTHILTILVGVHSRYIQTKFEANQCSSLREVKILSKIVHNNYKDKDDDDYRQNVITRVTLTHGVGLKYKTKVIFCIFV